MSDSESSVSESAVRKQAVFFYLAPALWVLYLFLLPRVVSFDWRVGIAVMVFPGLWLFTWLGYLMHESWHKYVPNVNNRLWYEITALLILTDPQLYSIIHGTHHSGVHTWGDIEFHPFGEVRSRPLRIVFNLLEIVFGVAFLMVAGSIVVPADQRFKKKYHRWKLPLSLLTWGAVYGGIGYLSGMAFHLPALGVVLPYALMIWLGSFMLHQSQLIEHGNLIVDGDFHQRNVRSRNLRSSGLPEKLFLFLTHNDSREHVLHHTLTRMYLRPFPGTVPLPPGAPVITLAEYARILGRMLSGRVDHETADAPADVTRSGPLTKENP